jgi:hypothetical protein
MGHPRVLFFDQWFVFHLLPRVPRPSFAWAGTLRFRSRLRWQVRRRALAQGLAAAVVRDEVHLLAFRAGALHVGKADARAMTTAQADVAILRPAEHPAEFAAQNTIGTAYDPFRHFLQTLLPLYCAGALEPDRWSGVVPTTLRTSGGRHGTISFRLDCLRRKIEH